jgi:hypothetical protein
MEVAIPVSCEVPVSDHTVRAEVGKPCIPDWWSIHLFVSMHVYEGILHIQLVDRQSGWAIWYRTRER